MEGTPNAGRLAREKKMLNYLNGEYAIFISWVIFDEVLKRP